MQQSNHLELIASDGCLAPFRLMIVELCKAHAEMAYLNLKCRGFQALVVLRQVGLLN